MGSYYFLTKYFLAEKNFEYLQFKTANKTKTKISQKFL